MGSGGVVYYIDAETNTVKFLLLKHKGRIKNWDLPKGHLKKKESFEECALREVHEETGIQKDKLKLQAKLQHKNIYTKKRQIIRKKTKVIHVFLFQALTDKIKIDKAELVDYKWVKFEKLEKKLTNPEIALGAFIEANDIINSLHQEADTAS